MLVQPPMVARRMRMLRFMTGAPPSTLCARMQKLRIQISRPDPRHGRGKEAAYPSDERVA